jgi:hypothetical protein
MGILDQAIREHLELKRRRGATESELRQLEDEAFGPPTRPGEPDFPEHAEPSEQSGNGVAREGAVAAPGEEATDRDLAPAAAEPATEEPVAVEHPIVEEGENPAGEAMPREAEETPIESLDTVEHPFPGEEEPPAEESGAEPAGKQFEGAAEDDEPPARSESEGAGDEEDVLADTPEFLKDAPEDDELWFEQGEPKDFDF